MANRLAGSVSPYLRSHADNPVDWQPWGEDAFAEAVRRDVPMLISIGYSTCHWCHVMARESFSDPQLAAYLNDNFVSVKVDREEHPDVDTSYLAAAGAFTDNLGWPLNVFVTPRGRTFFAGTYFPPVPVDGHPAFRQVLDAVLDAWRTRRDAVEQSAAQVAEALATAGTGASADLPERFDAIVAELVGYEDQQFGGFGGAPKFPVAPVLLFLLERASTGDEAALGLARRTLVAMAASDLRDPVEGGFFRYATRRDWTDPHYERMLYDNALLLQAYTRLDQLSPGAADGVAAGIADFLLRVMRRPSGGFASAQDSESTVDGVRVEGGYYALDAAARANQSPPALDAKVLTGWNGLAIGALALAGFVHDRPEWLSAAKETADYLLLAHRNADSTLIRASIDGRRSDARAALEDYGMLAAGLLRLALVSGEARYATEARVLVDAAMSAADYSAPADSVPAESVPAESAPAASAPPASAQAFAIPGGADPSLVSRGLAIEADASEGAYPSGTSALAEAAVMLYQLSADRKYLDAARAAMASVAGLAVQRPISFGTALAVMSGLAEPVVQLVAVGEALGPIRAYFRSGAVTAVVTAEQSAAFAAARFELFEGRDHDAVYLCRDFVCRLPETDPQRIAALLAG